MYVCGPMLAHNFAVEIHILKRSVHPACVPAAPAFRDREDVQQWHLLAHLTDRPGTSNNCTIFVE